MNLLRHMRGRKIRRRQALALDEYVFLRQATKVTGKITLPAPSTMHFYRCADFAEPSAYTDAEPFFRDLAAVFQQEIGELCQSWLPLYPARRGCGRAALRSSNPRADRRTGSDPDALVDLYIDSINQAVAECPAEVSIGVHMCRGNFKGHYLGAGGYESVAERFFANTNVNHFLLEYDTPRAGDFAPLRFVPKNKGVVLGLVSSKTPALESLDTLKRRTDEATRYIDLDRLAIGPQCGFASTVAEIR